MAEVKRICNDIKAKESSLDALFLSMGYIPWGGREDMPFLFTYCQTTRHYPSFQLTDLIQTQAMESTCSLHWLTTAALLFVVLLPPLKVSTNNPRIVNLGGAGLETPKLLLNDLDYQEPGNYTINNVAANVATTMSLTLCRLAEENPEVVFIFANPGLVITNIYSHGFDGSWYMKAFITAIKPLMRIVALSEVDAGERSMYLLTSARFGQKGGVLPLSGETSALTMMKTQSGALFSINYKLESVHWEGVMNEEQRKDAGAMFWERAECPWTIFVRICI
jgi:hypothetical protein